MKTAQLIKREERILYLGDNGEILSLNATEKLAHSIMGKETKTIKTEEVVTRFRAQNNKKLDLMFWNWMETENLESVNYFLVIDNQ
jgi:hypothetical protein